MANPPRRTAPQTAPTTTIPANTSAATPVTDALLEERQADEALSSILAATQSNTLFDRMVEEFKKAANGKAVTAKESRDFLPWAGGPYRVQVNGSEIFTWEAGGEMKAVPVLLVTVLDAGTGKGKLLVGKKFRLSCHWQVARTILDALAMETEKAVLPALMAIMRKEPQRITDNLSMMLVAVGCDDNGEPIKKITSRGTPVLAEATTMVY